MTTDQDSSTDAVLARGHVWLRFPKALEARFLADTLEPRRRLLLICGLIGIVSICLGSAELARLMPDIVEVAFRNLYGILAISAVGVSAFWIVPRRWRRNWHAEACTAVPLLAVNAGLIYGCVISHADTTFTHSAALVSSVMYACIAARLRFVWASSSAVASFVAYVIFVRGHTPLQELIVASTTALMAVSYVFALVANYAFEHTERRNWLLRRLAAEQRDALEQTSDHLHRLTTQDPLTRLYNRRQFDADLARVWWDAGLAKAPVALLSIDVDFFKRYNDTYGHLAGDRCLTLVAQALSKVAQAHGGIAARLGGEEFGLLLPVCSLDDALKAGTAMCEGVRLARIEHRASSVAGHVTVSVGVAQCWPAQGLEAQRLVDQADRALYQAKAQGRHQVCAADPAEAPGLAAPVAPVAPIAKWGSASAEPDRAEPPLAELPYTEALKAGFFKLRFPPAQEAAYRKHNAGERQQRLLLMSVLGLVIYSVYTFSHGAMFPDIRDTALWWQGGLSLVMLLMAVMNHLMPMPVLWREAVYSLGTAILAVASTWVLAQSREMSTLAYAVCLALIPMFSGVGARQPFWFTCVPSVITCLAVALLLRPVGAQQTLVFADSVLMIFTNTVFTLILAYTLERGARKQWLLSQIERLQGDALHQATQRLHELSMLDPLTGIRNRRQFEDDFEQTWARCAAERQPVAMLMIDVDFFKRYNDGYGHPQGDVCLKQVAAALDDVAREANGLAARLGGEEFGILLPGASADRARQLGERLCATVHRLGIEHRHTQVPGLDRVTVSVGAASLLADASTDPRSLLAGADDALYQAKRRGRHGVAVLGEAARAEPMAPAPEVTELAAPLLR